MTRLPRDHSVTPELISRQQEQALAEVPACATRFVERQPCRALNARSQGLGAASSASLS